MDDDDAPSTKHGRLNIKINASTSTAIKQLAADESTPTEVIRRAIALAKLIDDRRREGLNVWFVDQNGTRQARLELLY